MIHEERQKLIDDYAFKSRAFADAARARLLHAARTGGVCSRGRWAGGPKARSGASQGSATVENAE